MATRTREAFIRTIGRGGLGLAAGLFLGKVAEYPPEAYAQEIIPRITRREDLTPFSREELYAFQNDYNRAGVLAPTFLPIVFPPEGDFVVR